MTLRRKTLLLGAVLIVGIGGLCFLSLKVGYESGVKDGMQDSFYAQIIHSDRELSALNNLHRGDLEGVRSNLETVLAVTAGMLANEQSVAMMAPKTKSDITQTLIKIKQYRKANPYLQSSEEFRQFIDKKLEWVPEK